MVIRGLLVVLVLAGCATAIPPLATAPPDEYKNVPLFLPSRPTSGPRPIHHVEPVPSPQLVRSGRSATAVLEAVIGTDGRILAVWFSSGDPQWAAAAAVAVRQWRFEPAIVDGVPVPIRFRITVTLRNHA